MGLYTTTEQASTPATPASGFSVLYPKSDGLWYWKDDAGAEYAVIGNGTATSYTGTATGLTTSPTGTIYYQKIGASVIMDIPNFGGTSNAGTFTITGMPAAIFPATAKTMMGYAQNNGGSNTSCLFVVGTDGVITIYKDLDANAFTASGAKAFGKTSICYTLN
jgi:hypothetical protein